MFPDLLKRRAPSVRRRLFIFGLVRSPERLVPRAAWRHRENGTGDEGKLPRPPLDVPHRSSSRRPQRQMLRPTRWPVKARGPAPHPSAAIPSLGGTRELGVNSVLVARRAAPTPKHRGRERISGLAARRAAGPAPRLEVESMDRAVVLRDAPSIRQCMDRPHFRRAPDRLRRGSDASGGSSRHAGGG